MRVSHMDFLMGMKTNNPYSLLSNALRGVGVPFGGARRIEFFPALPGGHANASLHETDLQVLEDLETVEGRMRARNAPALSWPPPTSPQAPRYVRVSQLVGLVYEGNGMFQLKDKQRFRLLADQHVIPDSVQSAPHALIHALQGDGSQCATAHSIVLLDAKGQYEAICDITTFIKPALEVAVAKPQHPYVTAYIGGALAKTPILICTNSLTDEILRFDLPTLLSVSYDEEGVFHLPSVGRFGVLALRVVEPEAVHPPIHGFVLPRMHFRPPATALH